MTENDLVYYHTRLPQERDRAGAAATPDVARVHRQFAERYAALLGDGERIRPALLAH